MPIKPPLEFFIPDEQRREWMDELRSAMTFDRTLSSYTDLVANGHFFSASHPVHPGKNRDIRNWADNNQHLAVFVSEDATKFTVVCFKVLDWRRNVHSAFCNEIYVEIELYAHVTQVSDAPYVIHVIDPTKDAPVCYQHIFMFHGPRIFDATDLQVGDLLERFPGHVENILDQIGFVADVVLSESPNHQVKQ